MPTNLRPNQQVERYRIGKLLNKGAFANAYEAVLITDSSKVFFKQYKSPSVSVDWYKKYVEYQKELKLRIEGGTAKNYAYRFVEFFESEASGQKCFYQVFEFIDKGKDLDKYLDEAKHGGSSIGWTQRLTFAKLLMAGMKALHSAKIAHCDLKPKNLYLVEDSKIEVGYRLKIVDLDFALLADRKAPWDGKQGYTGTPGYFSPEHFTGKVPCLASDVFTCGLILYELLAQGHPYSFDDEEQYQKAALRHAAEKPRLTGTINPTTDAAIVAVLHACLNPDAAKRPTAEQVHAALLGIASKGDGERTVHLPPPPPPPPPPRSAPGPTAGTTSGQLTLSAGSGKLEFNITTPVGSRICRTFGEDARFMAEPQFTLKRTASGPWAVVPTETPNETLLNGKTVTAETPLKTGDVLAVGRQAKGVVKLPMTVRIGEG